MTRNDFYNNCLTCAVDAMKRSSKRGLLFTYESFFSGNADRNLKGAHWVPDSSSMKFNVLFWCLVAAEFYQVWCMLPSEMSKAIHVKCQKEIGATDQEIVDSRNAIFHLNNERQTCYLKCVLNELNLMDQNGKLTPLSALKFLPPAVTMKMRPIMGACGGVDDKNPCLKATKLYQCVHQKLPNLYHVP